MGQIGKNKIKLGGTGSIRVNQHIQKCFEQSHCSYVNFTLIFK